MATTKRSSLPLWLTGTAILAAIGLAAVLPAPRERKSGRRGHQPFGEESDRAEPYHAHKRRAHQLGRGRRARSPAEIPWPGWKDVLIRTYHQIGDDRLLAVAAGVVFYGLLALFPAITALVSSYGLFADAANIGKHLAFIASLLPAGAFGIVEEQITRIVQKGGGQLSFAFFLGLGIAIWSANAGMKAMLDALNVIYEEEEKRGFIRLNLISLAMTVGGLLILLLAIGMVIVVPLVLAWLGLGESTEWIVSLARWPVMLIVISLAIAVLYRFGPSRREPEWKWLSVGSATATILWVLGSAAFSYYLSKFADYDATYGSLGAAIGLMMWLWLTSICILVGAELNSEIEHQTAHDSTVGGQKPLGLRGATMADTVGEARG